MLPRESTFLSTVNTGENIADGVGVTVHASTRYVASVGADRGPSVSGGTAKADDAVNYTINVAVQPGCVGSTYNLSISTSILGMCGARDDQTYVGGSGVATMTDVTGYLNNEANGSLGLASAQNYNGSSSATGEGREFSGSKVLTLGPFTGATNFALKFTWTIHAESPQWAAGGDEQGVRVGYNWTGSGSSGSSSYAGGPSRTQDNDGHFVTITATVVTSGPAAPTASNGGQVCVGSTLNLYASTVAGATYAWTGPNGFTSAEQNPSIPNATAAAAGTYSVTATVGGCTSSSAGTTYATVNAIPSAPTASNGGTVCPGGTLSLTASTVSGATYAWTGPNGFTSAAQNPTIPNATTEATGTYSVTATVSGCPSAAGTTEATVGDTTPPTIIAPPDVDIDL